MAYEARTIEEQLRDLQDQFRELSLAMRQRRDRDRTPRRYRSEDDDEDDLSQVDEHNHYGRHNRDNRYNNDIKVDVPEFEGRIDPDEFVEWLRTVERVFDYKHTTEDKKVKLVALKLRKYASTWWANVCFTRERQGKEKVRDWRKMKKLLKENFLPTYYLHESFSKLHHIKQGTRNIEEFSQEFEHLLMKCDVCEDDPQTLVRYLGALDPRIANIVELQPYSSLAELRLLAHKVECQQKARTKNEVAKPVGKQSGPASNLSPTSLFTPEGSETASRTARRCFRYHGLGHIASDCPNKRVISLAEYETVTAPKYDEEPNHQPDLNEVVLGPDEGECLVVRRALNGTADHGPNQQREAIFRTRCTIKNKVCSMVIDGGSCTNVASQTMVSKLNLRSEPHPFPYDIQWLNPGKGLRVNYRVLLSYIVGTEYKDEVWCDIIPMDACHVLLGRPWLYDRHVVHDGYQNTYSFVKDGRNITLRPIATTTAHDHPALMTIESPKNVDKGSTQKPQGFQQQNITLGVFTVEKLGPPTKLQQASQVLESGFSSLRSNFFKEGKNDSNTSDNINYLTIEGDMDHGGSTQQIKLRNLGPLNQQHTSPNFHT